MAEGGKPLSFSKLASDWKGNPRSTGFKIRRWAPPGDLHINRRSMRQQFETSLAVFTTPIGRRNPAANRHWDIHFRSRPVSAIRFRCDFSVDYQLQSVGRKWPPDSRM